MLTPPCPQICAARQRNVAVIMDLQGPEIRTSYLVDRASGSRASKVDIKAGERITLFGTDDLSEDKFVGFKTEGEWQAGEAPGTAVCRASLLGYVPMPPSHQPRQLHPLPCSSRWVAAGC
jgi:hypothetical protein